MSVQRADGAEEHCHGGRWKEDLVMKRFMFLAVVICGFVASDSWAASPAAMENALFTAAATGNLVQARLLLKQGVKVDVRDQNGDTPLHWAAGHGYPAMVKILISRGADVNARDRHGQTPLFGADNAAVARLLIAHGALVNARDMIGQTPLDRAAWAGRIPVIRVLLDHHALVNARDINGFTPLDNAAWSGSDSLAVEALLRAHGAVFSRVPGSIPAAPVVPVPKIKMTRTALGAQ